MSDSSKVLLDFHEAFISKVEYFGPKIAGALAIILMGVIIAVLIYKLVIYVFKRFKLIELLEKIDFVDNLDREIEKKRKKNIDLTSTETKNQKAINEVKKISKKINNKIKIDQIVAKSASYYVFLIFFRFSIIVLGITEVEIFLGDLIAYLPNLFVAVIIGFFGIRFSNFVYDIVYHTLNITKQKTSKIVASGAKIIILFFTLMLVLNYTKIVDPFIINAILVGFISMLTLAGGLAFGLGGKDIAHEILESFRK